MNTTQANEVRGKNGCKEEKSNGGAACSFGQGSCCAQAQAQTRELRVHGRWGEVRDWAPSPQQKSAAQASQFRQHDGEREPQTKAAQLRKHAESLSWAGVSAFPESGRQSAKEAPEQRQHAREPTPTGRERCAARAAARQTQDGRCRAAFAQNHEKAHDAQKQREHAKPQGSAELEIEALQRQWDLAPLRGFEVLARSGHGQSQALRPLARGQKSRLIRTAVSWADPETWIVLIVALAVLGGGIPAGMGFYRRSLRPPPMPRKRDLHPSLEPDSIPDKDGEDED